MLCWRKERQQLVQAFFDNHTDSSRWKLLLQPLHKTGCHHQITQPVGQAHQNFLFGHTVPQRSEENGEFYNEECWINFKMKYLTFSNPYVHFLFSIGH